MQNAGEGLPGRQRNGRGDLCVRGETRLGVQEACLQSCRLVLGDYMGQVAGRRVARGAMRSEIDQTRLGIFEAISATNRMTCGEIVSMHGVTPATVSHHLKVLSEAKLIACSREGQFVYNEAIPETIVAYSRALAKIAGGTKPTRRR